MKGLLKKDLFVLKKQTWLFIVFLVAFSFNPAMLPFVVIYASMFPYTAMAYDERCKWCDLADMMPYSPQDIVLSKYVLGWLLTVAMALGAVLLQFIRGAFTGESLQWEFVIISLFLGMLSMDVTQPLMFRFGVEKARLVIMLLVIGLATASISMLQIFMVSGQ